MDNGKRFLPRIKEFFEKAEKPKTPVAPVEANGGTLESTEVKTVINDLTYIFEQIGPQAYLPENITLLIKQLFVTDSLSTLINFYQRIYKPKELEHKSARSFWPRYIEEEYAKGTKKEIPLHESVAGGAGVWGYQIDIEPTLVTDIDSNITKALSTVYNRNQTALRKLFETEQKKGNLPKTITFEDRLSPAYLDNWLNIVGKRRDPETKKALKEFDVKIGIGNERVRKPNSQFIGIRKNKWIFRTTMIILLLKLFQGQNWIKGENLIGSQKMVILQR